MRPHGWTLLELLMALGVLAVLLSLAVPAWTGYRNKAKSLQAGQEIALMATVIEGFRNERGAYPDSLDDVQLGGRQDPWGRAYRYYNVEKRGRGGARKDRALNPINTDFDLSSAGADGETHGQVSHRRSADDILRANNGRFVGLGADF
jgi:general secretion pathway protein G